MFNKLSYMRLAGVPSTTVPPVQMQLATTNSTSKPLPH